MMLRNWRRHFLLSGAWVVLLAPTASATANDAKAVAAALLRAGENKAQLQRALEQVPAEHREAMRFLVVNMQDADLKTLSAEFLLENVRLAYQARNESRWKDSTPNDVFLNYVLPYASVNEGRDNWRADFHERFRPLVKDSKSLAAAAAVLNQKTFGLLKVRYSTQRPKADQSPYESARLIVRLDRPIVVATDGKPLLRKIVPRTIGVLARTLGERGDPASVFSGEVVIDLGTQGG